MRLIKFILSLAITLLLIYALNNRLVINNLSIPPLGKFLDPFHGFWQNATDDPLNYEETIALGQLKEAVQIQYDSNFIPHIFAKNNEDLFMAQGYIVAQHRLWQMDFQSYAASGRVSELIGEAALDFDKLQRRKGMVYGAEKALQSMKDDPELWSYMEAYAKGVNTYIESLSYKEYPLEYKLMGYKPELWTPLKSALLLQYMIDNLTGWDKDLENTNAYNLFGEKLFKKLYPNWPTGLDPIAPTPEEGWPFKAVSPQKPDSLRITKRFMTSVHDMPDPDNGSNNWVVAGWKTKSGKPILSSDMHLGLNLPSLWFLIELNSPDFHTMGFCLAGNVGVVAGFNENNAWAFTDVARDERDWYSINFTDQTREEYTYEGTAIKTNQVVEKIKIRGKETYYDTVIYTHLGPVVYDRNFISKDNENNLALRWIGHEPSRVQQALIGLNKSSSYQQYIDALQYWDSPAQHVAFASTTGDIAIRIQGLWPNKFQDQGLFIMNGAHKDLEWQDFIPTAHYGYQHNPARGFVSSANQHSLDQQYPYWQGWATPDHYRGRRINRVLSNYDSASITPKDMMELQQDSYGILPSEILPFLLDSLVKKDPGVISDSLFIAMKSWDFDYTTEKIAPSIFISWWKKFKSLLWDEMNIDTIALKMPTDYQTTYLLKNDFPESFYDNKYTSLTESLNDVIVMSYDSAKKDLHEWSQTKKMHFTWGNYKGTSIIHLARLPALSRMNIQVNGEDDVVNSTKRNHGPSQRIVVEMTSPPTAWAIIPGGQSGNPGNPAYDNMINMWRDGEYMKLQFFITPSSEQDVTFNQTLNPSDQ